MSSEELPSSQEASEEALAGLGPRVKALREGRGLSLRTLAAASNLTASTISQIERNRTNPTFGSLYGIAAALGVRIDVFFPELADCGVRTEEPEQNVAIGAQRPEEKWAKLAADGEPLTSQEVESRGPLAWSVVRRADRRHIVLEGYGGQIRTELLTAEPERTSEFTVGTYMPGARSCRPPSRISHDGREYFLVLEGAITVHVGFDQVVVEAGGSMAFWSHRPHRYENNGSVPARGVWFVQYNDGTL